MIDNYLLTIRGFASLDRLIVDILRNFIRQFFVAACLCGKNMEKINAS